MDSECQLLVHDPDIHELYQTLETDDALLQRASKTTPAMRLGMIVWLILMSLPAEVEPGYVTSAWDKWDVQGRAITIWSQVFSRLMRSKKPPSKAIPTDVDALAAFQSAMDISGHHHDYQATPDLGAWTTMRFTLSELQPSELACWHFNDEDGCSLCDKRFRQKLQSEAGLDHIPPLLLVAIWEYFNRCKDFKKTIAFTVVQRPHLFSPEILKPVQDVLARRFPDKARRAYGLHYHLLEQDPVVKSMDLFSYWSRIDRYPQPWQQIEDMFDSLVGLGLRREGDPYFPPVKPMFWIDLVRVLGEQSRSQDEGDDHSWRPAVSLSVACDLSARFFGEERPPLDLDLLPEYVQCAVKQFCRATERDEHTCNSDPHQVGLTWADLDVDNRTRYAAAYALLYSTDVVPLLADESDDSNDCDACDDINLLYDCVDAISAGQIILSSKKIAKVLGFIKQLAVVSDDCKFTFPEDSSDVEDDSEDSYEPSQRTNDQQRGGSPGDEETIRHEIHEHVENVENTFDDRIFSDFGWPEHPSVAQIYNFTHEGPLVECLFSLPQIIRHEIHEHVENVENTFDDRTFSDFGWPEHPLAAHIYNFTHEGPLVEYTTMAEGHAGAQEHVQAFTDMRLGRLPFRAADPDSSLGEVMGLHVVPDANWWTQQPSELMATSQVAGPSRPKDNAGPNISKEVKKRELHAFFVTLFKRHGVPLGTTGTAEARLPWKKMTSILAEHGLEISGWPEGVPEPRSDGKADKGISGFNKYIGTLYETMKAGRINFQPLAGESQTRDVSRVRQREGDTGEEVDIRTSKKRKLAEMRKKPKDFVAGKSVMKF
ncbi:hypothetical protein C8R44DRAFT_919777 [Mycena epipterygia]|nr:hypothetical protein C8R44DRAFT_919777 [Mycena epipterygia]